MRDIFTKDFILKVLIPILATVVIAAIVYFAYGPFVIFLAMIVFCVLFFYSRYAHTYDKTFYEEYYEDGEENYDGEDSGSILDKVKNVLPKQIKEKFDNSQEDLEEYYEEEVSAKPKYRKRQKNYSVEPNPYDEPPRKVVEVQINNTVRKSPEPVEDLSYAPTQRISPAEVSQAPSSGAGQTRQYSRQPAQPRPKRRRVEPSNRRERAYEQQPTRRPAPTRGSAYTQQQERPATRREQPRQNTGYDEDYEFEYYPYDD